MAEKNIRVFKGLNSVTDPSFLDEAGGQLVWAENIDFRSGKIRALPNSEELASTSRPHTTSGSGNNITYNYSTAFTSGASESTTDRGTFWYYDQLYQASPWAQQDALYWTVYNEANKDYLFVYSPLGDRVPFTSNGWSDGYLRKKVGVPTYLEVKPDSQRPALDFNNSAFGFHSAGFDPKYAVSFTQNFLGNVEEGGLNFLGSSELIISSHNVEAYSRYASDSINLISYSDSINAVYSSNFSGFETDFAKSNSSILGADALSISLAYGSSGRDTRLGLYYDLKDVPSLNFKKGTIAARVRLDPSFFIDSKIYAAVSDDEFAIDEYVCFYSKANIGNSIGTVAKSSTDSRYRIIFQSNISNVEQQLFAEYNPSSGQYFLFKITNPDSSSITASSSNPVIWFEDSNFDIAPIAGQELSYFFVATDTGNALFKVYDPIFRVAARKGSSAGASNLDLITFSVSDYVLQDSSINSLVDLDLAFTWDQTSSTTSNPTSNFYGTMRISYGGSEVYGQTNDFTNNNFNIDGHPYWLLLGGPAYANWGSLGVTANQSFTDYHTYGYQANPVSQTYTRSNFLMTHLTGGVSRRLDYISVSISSNFYTGGLTATNFSDLFLQSNPNILAASSVDFPQTDPQNNNVSEFTSATTGEGSDIFPYGYTTHQNVYRLFNGEYLLMERLPLWVPDISSGGINTGGFNNDNFSVTLGSDLQSASRPEFTIFTTGDIVKFKKTSTVEKYFRYLGSCKLVFGSGSSNLATDTFDFKNAPSLTLNTEIESIFVDNTRTKIDSEFWEEVSNIDFVNKKVYDKVLDENLGDQSNSFFQSSVTGDLVNYTLPPKDLDGIANALYANMAFAWKGSRLYWSETLFINSWAEDHFYYNFPDEIMGVVAGAEQLTVITRTSIHTTTNRNPEEITFFDVANIGAISKYAVSNLEGNPVFISAYGVVLATRGGYDILTKDLLPDDVFKAADVGVNRTLGLDKLNACIGVYRDHVYFHLPNAGLFDLDMRSKNLTPLKIKENVTGRDLGVTFFHDFYDDKIVAVTNTLGNPQKLVYTSLVESFNAPPALAYSEWVAHSADCDLNRTDWKQFESLQFQGSGDVEVVLLDSDSVISYSNPLDMSAKTSDDYVFPVVNPVQTDNWSFTTGDDFITSPTLYSQSSNSLTGHFDVGDLVYLCLTESKGDGYSDYYRIEAISTNKLYLDRPITFDATFTSPLTGLRLNRSKTQSGVQGERIYFNKSTWDFKKGSKICIKHSSLGQAYYRYKGTREFIDQTYGFIILMDTPSGPAPTYNMIESVFLNNGNFNSQYWEPIGSSAKPWSKVLDITDQYGALLGQGLIDDTITLPKNTSVHRGMILHGKQKNGRQYWAQYLGDKTYINTSNSDVIITMVKEYTNPSTQSLEIESVMLHEDQIYQPYINVFPYSGYKIDFTNLDGSRVGVPFDCPVDRLSFIIRGTGKVIGVTINGF